MNIPITQSKLWADLEKTLGEQYFFIEKPDFQYLAIEKRTPLGTYLYLPYGPVAKDTKSMRSALQVLEKLGKERRALFIRIEPQLPGHQHYLPKNAQKSRDLSPKETWVLDLDDDPKSKLPSRLLRYHKNMENRGLSIQKSHDPSDIRHLLALQKSLAAKKGINTFSSHYLETELSQPFATLYLVKYDPAKDQKSPATSPPVSFLTTHPLATISRERNQTSAALSTLPASLL